MPDITMSDCLVARTQPYRERWAAENCLREGFSFYLPEITETKRFERRGKRFRDFVNKPLFPGYLFIGIKPIWQPILRVLGVSGIIQGSGEFPAIIRSADLLRIKAFEVDGVIRLPKKGFGHGDAVRIVSGAYAGYTGLVQGMSPNDRIQCLVSYMGREVPFLVNEKSLELVRAAA